jgi:zinc and cadmium transporter
VTSTLAWIVGSSLAMSAISLVGAATLWFQERTLKKLLLPLVALAAGTLLGGAFFHLIPHAVEEMGNRLPVYLWVILGFSLFFCLEQFLHWHHCHKTASEHVRPVTYLVLAADTLHNFIDGLVVAGSFLVDVRVGVVTFLVAAAHEVPQELGDFGILVHGGWSKGKALRYNFLSGLTYLLGGLITYYASRHIDVGFLLPFAAGNFIYIAAVDLVPEINRNERLFNNLLHFGSFLLGLAFLLVVASVARH